MKSFEFARVTSSVNSLSGSTLCYLQTSSLGVALDRRCSPYVSHQTVEFADVRSETLNPLRSGELLVSNTRAALGLVGHGGAPSVDLQETVRVCADRQDAPYLHRVAVVGVPLALVQPLIDVAYTYHLWDCDAAAVVLQVAVPLREVAAWAEDGSPIWRQVEPAALPTFPAFPPDWPGALLAKCRELGACADGLDILRRVAGMDPAAGLPHLDEYRDWARSNLTPADLPAAWAAEVWGTPAPERW